MRVRAKGGRVRGSRPSGAVIRDLQVCSYGRCCCCWALQLRVPAGSAITVASSSGAGDGRAASCKTLRRYSVSNSARRSLRERRGGWVESNAKAVRSRRAQEKERRGRCCGRLRRLHGLLWLTPPLGLSLPLSPSLARWLPVCGRAGRVLCIEVQAVIRFMHHTMRPPNANMHPPSHNHNLSLSRCLI